MSDVTGEVCAAYDAVHESDATEGVEAGLPERTIYIVGTDRAIEYAWQSDDPYVAPDMEEVAGRMYRLGA